MSAQSLSRRLPREPMDPTRVELCNDFEQRLGRLACDAMADPAPEAMAREVHRFAIALDAAGLTAVATRVRATEQRPLDTYVERLKDEWEAWRAADELAGDVEALRADAELSAMFVAESLDHLGTIEATLLKLEENPDNRQLVDDVFRPFHTVKGNAGALGLLTVQHLAHTVESLLDRCRSGRHPVGPAEIDVVLKSVDLLTALITDVAARAGGSPGKNLRLERLALLETIDALIAGGASSVQQSPRAASSSRDRGMHGGDASATLAGVRASGSVSATPNAATSSARPSRVATTETVRVDTRKLDGLVDLVGELVILQSLIQESTALARVADQRLMRHLARLRRVTGDLQRGAMSMRMVPIRQTFQKMSRLVRDLCRKSGKQVELILAGEDTELDRKVVEGVTDPLMHMVRNSVDHGIEPADRRMSAGKREVGRVWLRAFHRGGDIVIEIADDGGGLDTRRILEKAIAEGIVAPGDALSDDAVHQLIFRPGFSTAETVTEISGRGVGMDVVRRNIEALRGRIDIKSVPGSGTTFSIRLPLTLATLDGLLVASGGERFVIPTFAVRESLRPRPGDVHSVKGKPSLVQVRDQLVPLVWLTDFFAPGATPIALSDATVVVIEDESRLIGLVVDRIVGKQQVVVKSLGEAFAGVRGVTAGAILGDGRVGLILDAPGIMTMVSDHAGAASAA